jgi:2-polyprenyl-3-methyl-5-hydroxy-6-metoxy-1,4-benzoquinol methylase
MNHAFLGKVEKVRGLDRAQLLSALAVHTATEPQKEMVACDYALYRSTSTGLEYAEPMTPGSDSFYRWLGTFDWYYPEFRWEFKKVKELAVARAREQGSASVIDVGCGSGEFLSTLLDQPNLKPLGIETSSTACELCAERGVKAANYSTSEFLEQKGNPRSFDVVTSFHVLEHVPDPLQFVQELVQLVKEDGIVCISTPLSPMFFECVWFDVLNHPPHHLTRWTTSAYRALAKELNLAIDFAFPEPTSLARQISVTSNLVNFGPRRSVSRLNKLTAMLLHPFRTIKVAGALLNQKKNHPETQWNSVLVILSRNK